MNGKDVGKRLSIIVILTVISFTFILSSCNKKEKTLAEKDTGLTESKTLPIDTEKETKKESTKEITKEKETSKKKEEVEERILTEEEEKLVGIWEAENGSILAIRARKVQTSGYVDFPLDAIYLTFNVVESLSSTGLWIKFTREDGSSIEEINGMTVLCDTHGCPAGDTGAMVLTEYRAEYFPETDTIVYKNIYDGQIFEECTLVRTDKSIEEADWDFYYDIHQERDPR